MQLLPEILSIVSKTEHSVTLQLRAQATLHYFPNHFAGFPLLPGVVQLNWVMHYCREQLHIVNTFKALENIKFQSIVRPDQVMQLHLQWQPTIQRLEFEFAQGEQIYSSGRVSFTELA